MGKDNKDDKKPSSKDDFNRAGWHMYSIFSSIPFSLVFAAVSYGQYSQGGGGWWLAGAIAGALGAAGGIYESVRYIREQVKNTPPAKDIDSRDDDDDDDDDWGAPPPKGPDLKP